jgi:Flp pilus assembly protein CpaB
VEVTGKRYKAGGGSLRKLMSTRHGTAIVAAVCTAVAAGLLLVAAANYRHSVDASGQPETVLVASSLIQKGTPGDIVSSREMFKAERIVAKQVTAGAIADASVIQGKVAATDIRPGQQLTLGEFAGGAGLLSELAPNQRAISAPVTTSQGLSGILHAGDRVDVYAILGSSGSKVTESSTAAGSAVRLLLANVSVLEVNLNASSSIGGNGVNAQSNVVLKVNANDAGAVAFAAANGGVWLALRGANATGPTVASTSTLNSLLLGSHLPQSGGK